MRAPALIVAAVWLFAVLSLPALAAADITVEVPGAAGFYRSGDSRCAAVDFGAPLASVLGLRIRWEGTGTAGLASIDGQDPVPWAGWLCCHVDEAPPTGALSVPVATPDGAFVLEASLGAADAYAFLDDGSMDACFTFGEHPLVDWDDLQVLVTPECTLERVTVTVVTTVPVGDTTWGAVKRPYGR